MLSYIMVFKIIYRNQCMDRLYIPRREGGLGLIEINDVFRQTITNLDFYLRTTTEEHMKKVKEQHQDNLPESKSITKLANVFKRTHLENSNNNSEQQQEVLNSTQQQQTEREEETASSTPSKHPYTHFERVNKRNRWQTNKRAGRFYEELQKNYIDQKGSVQWVQNGELKFDEERIIIAAQDQGLMTNGFKKMCGLQESDKCRFCHKETESSNHLISGCQTLLADGHYTKRHNKVCSYIHWTICQAHNNQTEDIWKHQPEPVTANKEVTIFYDKPIPTGRYIENKAIKPDIVVRNHLKKSALIIDISVPIFYGINRAEREKITKYQDLKHALKEEWQLEEIEVIPIIIGATGLMKDNLQKYLDTIPGKPKKYECQVSAIRGTVSILKRCLGTKFL